MNKLIDFQSHNLQVDYISFNLQNGIDNVPKIAQFFYSYHRFNCYSYYTKIKSKKPYLTNPSYELEMIVVFNVNPVNRNTIGIQFSGLNARHFYSVLKTQKFK